MANLWQRLYFRRREKTHLAWEKRRTLVSDDAELRDTLGTLTKEQGEAILRLGQRVIDGRIQILATTVNLETAVIHEMRGGVLALEDFMTNLEALLGHEND